MRQQYPIRYNLGNSSQDGKWHILRNRIPLCGERVVVYENRMYGLDHGFLYYRGSRYCERCGQIDAHNGLPPVSQENSTDRETTSERTGDSVRVEVTRFANPDRNTYSLGLSVGGEYGLSSDQYNQLGSSSISRIEQAVNTPEAGRSRSHRTRVFYDAVEHELSLLRQNETRVQRERSRGNTVTTGFAEALRSYRSNTYGGGNW